MQVFRNLPLVFMKLKGTILYKLRSIRLPLCMIRIAYSVCPFQSSFFGLKSLKLNFRILSIKIGVILSELIRNFCVVKFIQTDTLYSNDKDNIKSKQPLHLVLFFCLNSRENSVYLLIADILLPNQIKFKAYCCWVIDCILFRIICQTAPSSYCFPDNKIYIQR